MRRFSILAVAAILASVWSVPASAYYHFIYYLSSGNAPAKFDLTALPNKTVWVFVSEAGPTSYAANDGFSSVVAQIRQATQVWNNVGSSDIRVGFGGLENTATLQNTPATDVVFEDLPPGLLGYGGPTISKTPVLPKAGTNATPFFPIVRSTVHLNINAAIAPGPSYNESFFMTVVHEMGHALGLQHTFTSATMSTATTRSTSLGHPLDDDDIAGLSVLYPTSELAQTGSITGRITSGGNGVHLASVVAIRAGVGAISALTNADGTYRIDGITPGTYFVYAHPLPPDADIKGPWDASGSLVVASGPTNALFYPGTTDLLSANSVTVAAGKTQSSIDIALTNIDSVPVYDVAVYGYFNNYTIAVKPAYINMQAKGVPTVVASGIGLGSNGQAPGLTAQFAGGSAIVSGGSVRPYQANGYTYIAMGIGYMLGANPGPEHMIFTTASGFMHVLPSAVHITTQDPPTIQSVVANNDGTVALTGTNWTPASVIYFDGLAASIGTLAVDKANANAGTAIVTPPPGVSGQTAVLTVYNPDGQTSQFVQSASPATYTYGKAIAPVISSVNPASLPAGSEGVVDITGVGFNFLASQPAVGFGSSDIVVRRIFVLGPNHLQVDVSVAPGSVLSSPDVSVITGFQMATAPAGFHITAHVNGLPAPIPVLTNALPGLTGSYAGAVVSMYGNNLSAENATPVVTFNGEAARILYSSVTQVNLVIPGDLAPGLALMRLNNGVQNAYSLTVGIDTPPATIAGIADAGGNLISTDRPAVQGDLLSVNLTGFAPDGASVDNGRVQISLGGVSHPARLVTQALPGTYQVQFLLGTDQAPGKAQSLIVYLDGRSSYPAAISVTTLAGSFDIPTPVSP